METTSVIVVVVDGSGVELIIPRSAIPFGQVMWVRMQTVLVALVRIVAHRTATASAETDATELGVAKMLSRLFTVLFRVVLLKDAYFAIRGIIIVILCSLSLLLLLLKVPGAIEAAEALEFRVERVFHTNRSTTLANRWKGTGRGNK